MEKPHFHSLIVLHIKVLYCAFAAVGLAVIAILDVMEAHYRFASVAALFSVLLLTYSSFLLLRGHHRSTPYIEWFLVSMLGVFTLFGMQQSTQVVHWIYFVPAFVYFIFPFKGANVVALFYSLAVIWIIIEQFPSSLRVQMIFTYLACVAFSSLYALMNDRANKGLEDIIDTDPLTNVYSQNQLLSDLTKETTRADRQGSKLYLIGVEVPQQWKTLKVEEYEQRVGFFGTKLKRCLRKYDTCYRLANDRFIILMPNSSRDAVERLEEDLRDDLEGSDRFEHLSNILLADMCYDPVEGYETLISQVEEQLDAKRTS